MQKPREIIKESKESKESKGSQESQESMPSSTWIAADADPAAMQTPFEKEKP
jgi:hypothetical protein